MFRTDTDLVEVVSPRDFTATVARLKQGIADAGLTLFATIDHAAAASSVGLSMPPTIVLIYGAPRGGTPLMLAKPALALDLPLRVLVRIDSDGGVVVSFHPIAETLRRAGLGPDLSDRLTPAQDLLIACLQA